MLNLDWPQHTDPQDQDHHCVREQGCQVQLSRQNWRKSSTSLQTSRKILKVWPKIISSRRLTRSNPQHLPHHRHQDRAGPGPSLRNCRGSRTLINDPADPEIIANRTTSAKSKRTDVAKSKNKHDVDTAVHSKSKRIATQVSF